MAPRFQHNPVVRLCRSSASTANAPFPSPAAIAVSLSMPPALLHVLAWAGDRPPAFLSGHPHGSLRESDQPSTSSSRGGGPSPDEDQGPSSSGSRSGGGGGPASPSCFFFAYGSSLHRENLVGRDIRVQSRVPATVRDPNVHLVFRHRGACLRGHTSLRLVNPLTSSLLSPSTHPSSPRHFGYAVHNLCLCPYPCTLPLPPLST